MKKIGVLFSLTGTTSVTEMGQYHAALFALQEHNRQVRSEDELVEFCVRDIQSDPVKAVEEARTLIEQEDIRVFIGTYTSVCRKALLKLLEEKDCLLIYPAVYEGNETHPNVFYTGEVPNQQVIPLLQFIKKHYGPNIFLLGNEYIYPQLTNQELKRYWSQMGGEIAGEIYVPFGHSHYRDILAEIHRSEANAIFSTLIGESVVPFYRMFKGFGLNPNILPIFSPITKETEIKAIGPHYAEGHYSSGSYFQSLLSKGNQSFVTRFKKEFAEDPVISSVMFNTYLGTKLVLEKLVPCEQFQSKSFLDSLCNQTFSSPSGLIRVEKNNHHLSRPIRIGRADANGQFTIVWDSKKLISAEPFNAGKEPGDLLRTIEWESLFEELDREGEDAALLLDQQNAVLFANEPANRLFGLYEGQMLPIDQIKSKYAGYHVTVKHPKAPYRTIVITGKSGPDQKPYIQKTFAGIRTWNPEYQTQLKLAEAAADSDANVMILGETGVGKEVLAQAIQSESKRKNGPFIAINAGAIPRELIASELFGFTEGAFTGASKGGKKGKFEQANGGTLFLDEIGEMPLDLQISLLRVLETKSVVRLGDHRERKIDVRFIAATNRNLQEEIAYQGTFRADLFYRLNVMSITIPPLRERIEDIEPLSQEFLASLQRHYQRGPSKISEDALHSLRLHSWPGNIRELRNIMERAFLLARSAGESGIRTKHLPLELQKCLYRPSNRDNLLLEEVEKKTIQQALRISDNISHAAKLLGISRSTLYRKMKSHALTS